MSENTSAAPSSENPVGQGSRAVEVSRDGGVSVVSRTSSSEHSLSQEVNQGQQQEQGGLDLQRIVLASGFCLYRYICVLTFTYRSSRNALH